MWILVLRTALKAVTGTEGEYRRKIIWKTKQKNAGADIRL